MQMAAVGPPPGAPTITMTAPQHAHAHAAMMVAAGVGPGGNHPMAAMMHPMHAAAMAPPAPVPRGFPLAGTTTTPGTLAASPGIGTVPVTGTGSGAPSVQPSPFEYYLQAPARVREWFPDHLPGLYRCSRAEVMEDLETIQLHGGTERVRYKRRGNKIEKEQQTELDPTPSKRSRLAYKVQQARRAQTGVRASHQNLRRELDQLRLEILQYEDAIQQSKREIDALRREREAVDERYLSLREDFEQSVQSAALQTQKYEAEERQLRNQLATETNNNAEAGQNLQILQQLDDAIRTRDHKLVQMEIELHKSERHRSLVDSLLRKYATNAAVSGGTDVAAELAAIATAVASEPVPVPVPVPTTDNSAVASTAAAAAGGGGGGAGAPAGTPAAATSAAATPAQATTDAAAATNTSTSIAPSTTTGSAVGTDAVKSEVPSQAPTPDATATATSITSTTPVPGAVPPTQISTEPSLTLNSASSTSTSSHPSTSSASTVAIPTTPAEVVALIRRHTDEVASLQHELRASEEVRHDLMMKLHEYERHMESRDTIIDRQNQQLSELQNTIQEQKQQLKEEAAKLLSYAKEVQMLTRHKDDQEALFTSQADKQRVYQQILAVADRRATEAEESLKRVINEMKVIKSGNTLLQRTYNRLLEEYRIVSAEKNDLIEELNEKELHGVHSAELEEPIVGTTTRGEKQQDPYILQSPNATMRTKYKKIANDNRGLMARVKMTGVEQARAQAHIKHLTQLVDDLSRQLYGDAYEPQHHTFTDQAMAQTQHQQLLDVIQQQQQATTGQNTINNNGPIQIHPYTQFVPNHINFHSIAQTNPTTTSTSTSTSVTASSATGTVLQAAKVATGAAVKHENHSNGTHAPTTTVK